MTNKSISQLTAGGAVSSTDLFPDVQTVGVGPVRVTAAQIGDYVLSGSGLTGVLPVSRGGTGLTSLTAGRIPYGDGTNAFGNSANLTYSGGVLDLNNIGNQFGETLRIGGAAAWRNTGDSITGVLNAYSGSVWMGAFTNHTLNFVTNNIERMRLDASGNLGLGVTPSAWGLGKAIEVNAKGNALWSAGNADCRLTTNAYYDSAYRYGVAGYANMYECSSGSHKWWNAPSGTAGNAISFTQAMTLDASGNLLVGTTSGGGISDGGATNPGVGLERVGTITAQRNNDANMFLSKASGYTNGDLINFYVNNSRKGVISTDGTNTTYGTSSDISLKENISDAASALASILTMPIRQFDWKVGGHTDYGVVAQEADGYAPEIVTKGDIWAVDYGRITPRLIKAFQELAAKVSALEAKQ